MRSGGATVRKLRLAAAALGFAALAACASDEHLSEAQLYAKYCSHCHGDDGRGGEGMKEIEAEMDLTTGEMLTTGDREGIRRRIAGGHGAMPGFSRKLSPEQIQGLVDYTLSLRPQAEGGNDGSPATESRLPALGAAR